MDGEGIKRMQFPGYSKFKLDRRTIDFRTSRWTKCPVPVRKEHPQRMYMRSSPATNYVPVFPPEPVSEYNDMYVELNTNENCSLHSNANVPLSLHDAEKVTEAMIDSFATNPAMRELLESARFFAGAASLGGASRTRRAKTVIQRFESYGESLLGWCMISCRLFC